MRKSRGLWALLSIVAILASIATIVVRARPVSAVYELAVAVASPYMSLALALSGVAMALLSRQVIVVTLALMVAAAATAVQMPWYYFGEPATSTRAVELRVLTSNLRHGQADPVPFVTLAEGNADVIAVSELTQAAVERLADAGIRSDFPHAILSPAPGAGGIGLYSRYPLAEVSFARGADYSLPAARISVPGVGIEPIVASVHVGSPVAAGQDTVDRWKIVTGALKTTMGAFAVGSDSGAVIIAGDFNSTPDVRQFRDLMTNGYRDAVQQSGSGFAPTFPSRSWHPPLLTIDHIITRNAAAQSVKTVYIPGSDHRALLATIKVPLDPATP